VKSRGPCRTTTYVMIRDKLCNIGLTMRFPTPPSARRTQSRNKSAVVVSGLLVSNIIVSYTPPADAGIRLDAPSPFGPGARRRRKGTLGAELQCRQHIPHAAFRLGALSLGAASPPRPSYASECSAWAFQLATYCSAGNGHYTQILLSVEQPDHRPACAPGGLSKRLQRAYTGVLPDNARHPRRSRSVPWAIGPGVPSDLRTRETK
jgi:hypothetical protein